MADYDTSKPADSDLISQYPANERDARAAVETNFGIDHHEADDGDVGKHEIVQMLVQTTPTAVAGQGHFYTKDTGAGAVELFHQDEAGNEVQVTNRGAVQAFPSGTNMVFNQAAAPTGWTQDTSLNDRVLRVVNNTGTGGSDGGSWTISGVTVDGHTLTVSEMPSHNHGGSTGSDGSHNHTMSDESQGDTLTYLTGGDGAYKGINGTRQDGNSGDRIITTTAPNHTHSISSQGGGSAHNHGLTADGNWRPLHRDVIAATKD